GVRRGGAGARRGCWSARRGAGGWAGGGGGAEGARAGGAGLGDGESEGWALLAMAQADNRICRWESAIDRCEAALDRVGSGGSAPLRAQLHQLRATALSVLWHSAEARRAYELAREAFDDAGDARGGAFVSSRLANLMFLDERVPEAQQHLESALATL